jgi:hypothetical protein
MRIRSTPEPATMKREMFFASLIRSLVIGLLLAPVLTFSKADAQVATISDISISCNKDDLLLNLKVNDCFTPEMDKAIDNGVPTTFDFLVRLYEIKDFQFDRRIVGLLETHDIRYDSLKKTYAVTLSEHKNKVLEIGDFEKAKRVMCQLTGMEVTDIKNLKRGHRYQVQAMAELNKIRLPFYLHYVLFFLSLWDFETDWHTIEFTY